MVLVILFAAVAILLASPTGSAQTIDDADPCTLLPAEVTEPNARNSREFVRCFGYVPLVDEPIPGTDILRELTVSITRYETIAGANEAWDRLARERPLLEAMELGDRAMHGWAGASRQVNYHSAVQRGRWFVHIYGTDIPAVSISTAEGIHAAIEALPDAAAPTPVPAPTSAVARECTVSGTVLGSLAQPLDRALVRVLRDGIEVAVGASAADGSYQFAGIDTSPTADNPTPMISVEFELVEQLGDSFSINGKNGDPIGIALEPVAPGGAPSDCMFDVDSANLPASTRPIGGATSLDQWLAGAEIFRYVDEALTFAELELGADVLPATRLSVYIDCDGATSDVGADCASDPDNSFYLGPWTGDRTRANAIVLDGDVMGQSTATRRIIVYHEIGHFVNNVGFGSWLPIDVAGRKPHGGLYKNDTSTDALMEGFANFFAALVREHVGGTRPGMFDWAEGPIDIEQDRKIWDMFGKDEEWAFAGVLLDLVDGGDSYPQRSGPEQVAVFDWTDVVDGPNLRILAETQNQTESSALIIFEVELNDGRIERLLTEPVITQRGDIAKIDGTAIQHQGARVRTVRARSIQGVDDDSVELPLRQVWELFAASPAATTVADFYLTMTFELDEATMTRVDEIFVAHGFFNDTAAGVSNREHDDGEAVGLSGYRNLGGQDRPDRFKPVPQGVTEIPFSVAGPGADNAVAEVEVIMAAPREHLSYRYSVSPNADGNVHVTVPAPDLEAVVRVTARGEGLNSTWLADIDPVEFWSAAVDADTPPISLSGTVTTATGGSGGGSSGGGGGTVGSGGSGGFGVGPALAAVLVFSAVGGGVLWTRRRSATSSMAPALPNVDVLPGAPPFDHVEAPPPVSPAVSDTAWWNAEPRQEAGQSDQPADAVAESPPPQPDQWWNDGSPPS